MGTSPFNNYMETKNTAETETLRCPPPLNPVIDYPKWVTYHVEPTDLHDYEDDITTIIPPAMVTI